MELIKSVFTWASALMVFVYCLWQLEIFELGAKVWTLKVLNALRIMWWMALALLSGWILLTPLLPAARLDYPWGLASFMMVTGAYCGWRVALYVDAQSNAAHTTL